MAKSPRSGKPAAETIEIPASSGEAPSASELEKLRRYHAEVGDILARYDTHGSWFDKLSLHARRHMPLYALAAIFALVIVLVPTANDRKDTSAADEITAADSSADDTFQAAGPEEISEKTASKRSGPTTTTRPGSGVADTATTDKPIGRVVYAGGKTIGGYDCEAGVRQMPWSTYANPCVAKFTGNNGGKTFRGVDDKTIRIGIRKPAVDAGDVTDAQARAQGAATRAEGINLFKKYASYFQKVFELYGRKIEFVDFQSRVSNGVEEAQSRGEEGACADATDLAETQNVFGVVGYNAGLTETQPFSDCAAERRIFVPFGASYFPEKWYTERWHPYVWHVLQECERIAHDVAEYVGKRILNRNAKWALDPVYQKQKRVFGTYVPDNDGYQRCVNIFEQDLKAKYGGSVKSRYDYLLDVARFPDQARQAVLKFKADGVTTLINACDTLSTRFLSESADDIDWGPEWFIIGVATQDTDGAARTFDQDVVDGHLFGMSQVGKTADIEGKTGESYKTWKTAFPSEDPARGYGAVYYRTLALFVMLQAAGPVLTPQNIAKGLQALPDGGGGKGAQGTWSFKGDHTAVDDSREIYWKGSATGYDGNDGAYLEANGGKRFRTGQWPRTEPAIYAK